MLRFLADHLLRCGFGYDAPISQPEHGLYHPNLPVNADVTDWQRHTDPTKPTAAVLFYRSHWLSGNTAFVDALLESLEARGINAVGIFSASLRQHSPHDNVNGTTVQRFPEALKLLVDPDGKPLVDVLVNTISFAMGDVNPDGATLSTWSAAGLEALNASWREATPLGRAEWLKYTALFYNVEAQAEEIYTDIVTQYDAATELAAGVPQDERPVVLWNRFSPFTEAWTIPGAETYAGHLVLDAGGQIALGELAPTENAPVSFEVIVDGALDTDIWVTNATGMTTFEDLLAADPRFGDFAAAQNGAVWNNTLDLNENGGNNYFELGVTNPHLILQDLVAIFHPDLLPDHEFNFYMPLEPVTE